MDPRGLNETQNAYVLLLTHTKELLIATFCDITKGNGVSFLVTHMNGSTDVLDEKAQVCGMTFRSILVGQSSLTLHHNVAKTRVF